MKKIILISTVFTILFSCSEKEKSQDEIVKQYAEEYIKPLLNDAESYEFVELKLTDSVLYKNNIESAKESFNHDIEFENKLLNMKDNEWAETQKALFGKIDSTDIVKSLMKIENYKSILLKIDSLEADLGDSKNNVASYTYTFSFRGNNKLGAKVLNQYYIQTDPNPSLKIINMTDNKDKLFLNPNGFKGYQEMIQKYMNQ
jgi:FtsZ-binding cell division protein ZapB